MQNYSLRTAWKRKVFHFLGIGTVVLWELNFFELGVEYGLPALSFLSDDPNRAWLTIISTITLIILIFIEVIRLNKIISWLDWILAPLLKEDESNRIHGAIPYFMALTLLLITMPKSIAILGVLNLVFVDPVASLIGMKYGKVFFINGKSLEGSIAGIFASLVAISIWIKITSPVFSTGSMILFLIIIPLVAVITELVCGRDWFDDNFWIPISVSVVGFLLTEKIV